MYSLSIPWNVDKYECEVIYKIENKDCERVQNSYSLGYYTHMYQIKLKKNVGDVTHHHQLWFTVGEL